MDNTAVRAARVMNSQAAMLRRRMESSKPEGAPTGEGGMLFRRTIQMPPNTDLETLLYRWNPGVSPDTVSDLVASVCRWNQLKTPQAVQAGQQLLIPTVIPHGQEPHTLSGAALRPGAGGPPRPAAAPVRSPGMALSSQLAEQRARSVTANAAGAQTIWTTGNQAGQNLGGAQVKQQFQAGVWNRRA